MFYLICFLLSFITLLFLIANKRSVDGNTVILCITVTLGNGGYYALSEATNLEEAILANKISYAIGCFAPMIMFLILCDICRKNIKVWIQTLLYLVQTFIFLSVCTTGKSTIFYKDIDLVATEGGYQLVKTYGPMHTAYIILLCFFMLACIFIVAVSVVTKSCRVSTQKAEILLFLFLISTIIYFVERFAHLSVELMPAIFTVTNFFVVLIMTNISFYSARGNLLILEAKKKDVAYIVFNSKLMYMSANEYALTLFPELEEWQIEKKIPGNGGRFNTFLRIPFMNYVNGKDEGTYISDFEFMKKYYKIEISTLYGYANRKKGYVIEVALDAVKSATND